MCRPQVRHARESQRVSSHGEFVCVDSCICRIVLPLLRVSLYSEASIVKIVQIYELRLFLLTCCHNVQCHLQPIVHGEGKFVFGAEHTECMIAKAAKRPEPGMGKKY
jgi:hypothetical protein